jgi:hypothetical protein
MPIAAPQGQTMADPSPSTNDYLVLSRGTWDEDRSPLQIQAAIDAFYDWYARRVAEGTIKPGQRLAREGKVVSKERITDGPFAEAKEVIGGYWIIVAASLDEAAAIAAENPCIACGLRFEVRPIEAQRASADALSNETPPSRLPSR